jgi:hypothetical protein
VSLLSLWLKYYFLIALDFILPTIQDIAKLRSLYATVDDVDLLVAALLEKPSSGAMVGPIARCILADVFYRIRHSDRFFHDVKYQPGSYTRSMKNFDINNHYVPE